MIKTLRNAWSVPELRNKFLFTFFIILIFRIGSVITVPFIDVETLRATMTGGGVNEFFSYITTLTGGGLENGAIFAMGVTPYINSSIIMQLLTVAIPALGRMQQEGEEGRKKIAQITRYVTVGLGLLQGTAYFILLKNGMKTQDGMGTGSFLSVSSDNFFMNAFVAVTIVMCFTAGSALVMWLGERIDDKGIGNGISILLFAGIISRAPQAFAYLWYNIELKKYVEVGAIIVIFTLMIAFIVWMTNAERRIPIQYAKRVVGRKMYGGQSTHMPIKVNMSGVMPVIFASSILALPSMVNGFIDDPNNTVYKIFGVMNPQSLLYAVVYFAMIIGFAYFYATIQYNPIEMANNLRKNSGAIPGIRPGKPTSDFISRILSRITLIGALFLSVIALLPIIVGGVGGLAGITLGGTSVLIVVGVALDTVQNIESQMMMRHYKGFLD